MITTDPIVDFVAVAGLAVYLIKEYGTVCL